jgi:hypothetical protein
MAQDFATNMFDGGNVWSTDLQNIENALFTLNTMFSGGVAPSNPVEGKPWRDTAQGVLKVYTGLSWDGLMHGDALQKIWVYRNSAMAGWVVDATVSDRVLAFKGGTTYTTGGAAAGSWTHSHTDTRTVSGTAISVAQMPVHTHAVTGYRYNASNASDNLYFTAEALNYDGYNVLTSAPIVNNNTGGGGTHNHTLAGSVNDNTTFRPAASVGTLQRLDI